MPFRYYAFRQYNQELDEAAEAVCEQLEILDRDARFSERVRNYVPPEGSWLRDKYLDIWYDDVAEWEAGRDVVRALGFDSFNRPGPVAVREAFLNVYVRNLEVEPDTLEDKVSILYDTREERWDYLAKKLGFERPRMFRLYRGVTCDRYDYVSDVVNAWIADNDDKFDFEHDVLTCWSTKKKTARSFAKKNQHAAVMVKADVEFVNTLADKWVDDGAYILPWYFQDEVVVATAAPNSLRVFTRDAVVWFQGEEYNYSRRTELISAWQATQR
jgi:hypothetical protein